MLSNQNHKIPAVEDHHQLLEKYPELATLKKT